MNISTTYEAIVTRKGQVTIPAPVRRKLGLRRADRIQVSVSGDTVQLRRQETTAIEASFGIAQGRHKVLSPREEREAFIQAVVENVQEEDANG